MRKQLAEETLPKWFRLFNTRLESVGTGFYVGSNLTIADLSTYWTFAWFTTGDLDGIPTNILVDYPAIKAHIDMVKSIPKVLEWHEAHKQA